MTTTTTTTAQFATDATSTWIVTEITATGERITKVEQVSENTARQLAAIYNHHRTANGSSFEAVDTAAPVPAAEITQADVDAAWKAWAAATVAWRKGSDSECDTLHAAVKDAHAKAVALQAAYRAQVEPTTVTLPQPGIVARYDDEYTWPTRHRFGIQAWIERREAGFYAVVQCGDEREVSGPADSLAQQPRLQAWINERCHELVLWCAALAVDYELVADGTPADVEAEALASDPDDDEIGIDIVYTELLPFEPTADEARATLLEAEAQAGAEVCDCGAAIAYRCDQTGEGVCRACHQNAQHEWHREWAWADRWVNESRFGQLAGLAAA